MRTAYQTDIGRIRAINEDRVAVQENLNGVTLAVLADGMGGHQAGDIASQTAIETIQSELQSIHSAMSVKERRARIGEAIRGANRKVAELAATNEQYAGMGTTIVLALADSGSVIVAHIGDSRAYRVNADSMIQLTEDHSLVNELVRNGQITQEEAAVHPRRNVLTRALGTEPEVEVEINEHTWSEGDFILLCSDGLSSLTDSRAIQDILLADCAMEQKTGMLIELALQAGGDDNITVVLLANEQADREEG